MLLGAPQKPQFPHESANKEFCGATSRGTAGSSLAPGPTARGYGPPPQGHCPLALPGRVSRGCPQLRAQVVIAPSPPCSGRQEEDGHEDQRDKDMPRSPRDAEHAGGEATGMKPAWGHYQPEGTTLLGTGFATCLLSCTGPGVPKCHQKQFPLPSRPVQRSQLWAPGHIVAVEGSWDKSSIFNPSPSARVPTWHRDGEDGTFKGHQGRAGAVQGRS